MGQLRRTFALVLTSVDIPLGLLGRPLGIIQPHLADHPLDHALLIFAVEDLKILGQFRILPMGSQQAVGDSVESSDP